MRFKTDSLATHFACPLITNLFYFIYDFLHQIPKNIKTLS